MMVATSDIHLITPSQVVVAMQEYLGPAAERFVFRMLETHLHKHSEEMLTPDDVRVLSEKVEAALKHLDQDSATAEQASHTVLGLIK